MQYPMNSYHENEATCRVLFGHYTADFFATRTTTSTRIASKSILFCSASLLRMLIVETTVATTSPKNSASPICWSSQSSRWPSRLSWAAARRQTDFLLIESDFSQLHAFDILGTRVTPTACHSDWISLSQNVTQLPPYAIT